MSTLDLCHLKDVSFEVVGDVTSKINRFGIAFSGGIDSTLLAKICECLGKEFILLTIGFPNSHDINFSKTISSFFSVSHKIYEIKENEFLEDAKMIKNCIKSDNHSYVENCIAFYYISKLAKHNDLDVILSANGCDELFCGYDRYREIYKDGKEAIMNFMDDKIKNEFILIKKIESVINRFNVYTRQPFLTSRFINFAKTIPIDKKISGSNDLVRKHILRDLALFIGVPRVSAMKPKKAIQYGSLIHRKIKWKKSVDVLI